MLRRDQDIVGTVQFLKALEVWQTMFDDSPCSNVDVIVKAKYSSEGYRWDKAIA